MTSCVTTVIACGTSRSAVFAPLPAGQALQAAPAGWQVRICGNLEAHPLVGWAPSDD